MEDYTLASLTNINLGRNTLHGIEVNELSSIDQLSLPINRQIFGWWSSVSGKLPQKSDFKIDEHIRIASNLFLAERLAEQKYIFVVCGEEIYNITGQKSHKVTFEPKPDGYIGKDNFNQLIKHYERIVSTKKPYFCKGTTLLLGRHNSGFESADCPLFDDEGNVSHIIGTIELND